MCQEDIGIMKLSLFSFSSYFQFVIYLFIYLFIYLTVSIIHLNMKRILKILIATGVEMR